MLLFEKGREVNCILSRILRVQGIRPSPEKRQMGIAGHWKDRASEQFTMAMQVIPEFAVP